MDVELITLGGGCFWCIEDIYARLKGVSSATSGYEGGSIENPTYEQICTGTTNHAEVVQIAYQADVISLDQLLTVFFTIHDPTTLNRQGHDVGSQYRSVIYFHNEQQQQAAQLKIEQLNKQKMFSKPIVTEITQHSIFYTAESYHQKYFINNKNNQYCQLGVAKKVEKFLSEFQHLLK